MFEKQKIAIVYDWIDKWGGVERVLLTFNEMFPQAHFYSSYFDEKKAPWAKNLKIRTSFIQKLPIFIKSRRVLSLPFYPYAFESFNFNNYDLVISVTSSFAKAVVTQPKTKHICYLLTPTRFLWSHYKQYLGSYGLAVKGYIESLKRWDKIAAQRPDEIITISQTVAARCEKYYGRKSQVIYPPFDTEYWNKIKSEFPISNNQFPIKFQNTNSKFFLIVSRLEPYKRVDLAVETFNKLPDENLIVVGKGSMEGKLKSMALKNIKFLKNLSDQGLTYLYSKAQALIMPQEEDFGYVSLEAQFFGCPIIAYNEGGAKETIVSGKTGILFEEQKPDSLKAALARFHTISYNLKESALRLAGKNVEKYNKENFIKIFLKHL